MEKGYDGAHGGTEGWGHLKQVSMGQNDVSKFTPDLDLDIGLIDSEASLRLPVQTNQACKKLMLKARLLTYYFAGEINVWWEGIPISEFFFVSYCKLLCILDYKMSLTIRCIIKLVISLGVRNTPGIKCLYQCKKHPSF